MEGLRHFRVLLAEMNVLRLTARRHEEVWERTPDVGPAVWNVPSKSHSQARARGARVG